MEGKTALGASSPAKPALHIPEPLSTTRAAASSSHILFDCFVISLSKLQVGRQLLTEWTFQLPRGFYSPGFSYAWEKSPERLPYMGIESLFSVLSYGEIFLTVLRKLIGAESLAFLEPFKASFDFSNLTTSMI